MGVRSGQIEHALHYNDLAYQSDSLTFLSNSAKDLLFQSGLVYTGQPLSLEKEDLRRTKHMVGNTTSSR